MDKPVVTNHALLSAALDGLQNDQKTLPSKWFYDLEGSRLFEEITQLPEYYPSRTETQILRTYARTLSATMPAGGALVELGSGASLKTRLVLDAAKHIGFYVPVDIADDFLHAAASRLVVSYPHLTIQSVVADFTAPFGLPKNLSDVPKTAFFPGSTIGNLNDEQAAALLSRVRLWDGVEGFVLGADLVKSPEILIPAYDDAKGLTAAFNRNLLHRLNREAGASFKVETFHHEARWNAEESCIEMHLRSEVDQSIYIAGTEIEFKKGETIHTEISRKYTEEGLRALANVSGWKFSTLHTDPKSWFAVVVLLPA